ncbi:hypothetical protein [Brucella sp. IR073]|uniref:hypothetical protein n=1 Tax=unclassified Brucella TaxID=2632610 RepID=UPI003B987B42
MPDDYNTYDNWRYDQLNRRQRDEVYNNELRTVNQNIESSNLQTRHNILGMQMQTLRSISNDYQDRMLQITEDRAKQIHGTTTKLGQAATGGG